MKVVICDDDARDARRAEKMIKELSITKDFDISIKTPQDIKLAVEEDIFTCEILIIDIQFDGEQYNGIELAKQINHKLPLCKIVYLTNILDFAPYVYETEHSYFVMKENMDIMLPRAVEKSIKTYERIESDIIEVSSSGPKVYISQGDVIYIERNNRILEIHTIEKVYPCYSSLRKICDCLGESFVRCHGGFIVNLAYVSVIEGNEILLKNGCKIPVGLRFFDDFKMRYLKYYSDRI